MTGSKIKQYLINTGLKFNSIAEKSDIPMNKFSAILNGKRKITAEEYFAICHALDVPLDTFCDSEVTA